MAVYKRYKGEKITSSHPKYKESKWCCEFYADGKTFKKSIPLAKSLKDAENFEREFRQSVLGGNFEHFLDKTNFADFVNEIYLPSAKNNNASYETKIFETDTLKRFFGDYRLKAITPELIETFKSKRVNERIRCQKCKFGKKHECNQPKLSPSTVNRELTTLSKILEVARVSRRISENPMRFVKKFSEPDARERFLLQDEKERLFKELQSNNQLLAIVLIAVLTGWRRGQILSLQKSSLNITNQSVRLIKSKGAKARFVPVSTIVWSILNNLAENTDDF
jgi:integrase